ncbi:MAG: hypothetical protein A2W80_12465 [Candidatus Riflebacteria bacterium GWC2_50_8]|nr:MAG: hypothetical protein A2W80_12465 [Candidatus Riflebacteria bacterium GWC2_50_8]
MSDAYLTCSLCGKIPDLVKVELLHSEERLPPEVDSLRCIGGSGNCSSPQIRVCPECGTYYGFIHEHDSEAGMGEGYTEEIISRITSERVLTVLEAARRDIASSLKYWEQALSEGNYVDHARKMIVEEQAELEQIDAEITRQSEKT